VCSLFKSSSVGLFARTASETQLQSLIVTKAYRIYLDKGRFLTDLVVLYPSLPRWSIEPTDTEKKEVYLGKKDKCRLYILVTLDKLFKKVPPPFPA
jgi:hypothetical protein